MLATTFGTGELLRAVLDAGVRRITLGIGGSATTDGACGILVALGAVMRDARELGLSSDAAGAGLDACHRSIDLSDLTRGSRRSSCGSRAT